MFIGEYEVVYQFDPWEGCRWDVYLGVEYVTSFPYFDEAEAYCLGDIE